MLAAGSAFAQGTTGQLSGTVTDDQGGALPGAVVTVTNASTGFTRSATRTATGILSLPGLPVGTYDVKAELTGFARAHAPGASSTSAPPPPPSSRWRSRARPRRSRSSAEAPLIDVKDTGVGEIITAAQIENLPLNGRQFGNLAALVPGVSLGFHTDPTKSTQFAPQVAGGGGRNINYLIDGGDNNDDTVGGLVQNFPLDSIGEFNFETQRFRADSGRANGGTLKVVTKSGTNELKRLGVRASSATRASTRRRRPRSATGADKGEYKQAPVRRAAWAAPSSRTRPTSSLSFERVQQDTHAGR